ncbi:MerR family transcriptional regulator [Lampropedia cohaerens]|uniref:MerR family transcriptional regulator n=1 Tax=Lampropedia cohaerens TaxID=1610491 RepID=A0A0U1Q0W4_9BURK|nr:MerR family transcriptional regulator [Lampropedia cohaerens]KKW68408.1 MerR family transcriptional regulator [Lampropedia cohaerens]
MADEKPCYRIGDAARLSGVAASNIRYYEREGLIHPGVRGENGYRLYSPQDVHALRLIRLCRSMDMSLDEVRTLLRLRLGNAQDCQVAAQALDAHLGHVRERLHELQALERELQALRALCDGTGQHCGIIEALHRRADAPQSTAVTPPVSRHV